MKRNLLKNLSIGKILKRVQHDMVSFFTTHNSRFTKYAFTLAETLIVIGIIGVVAALTLPNLNHATGDKEKVTKVLKIYSALTDAFDRAQVIYGPYDEWYNNMESPNDSDLNERFAKRISEFMKISKDCGVTGDGCFSSAPLLDADGKIYTEGDDNFRTILGYHDDYMVMTSDGMSLAFDACAWDYISRIRVDIDGPNNGKNQLGSDLFEFDIFYPGSLTGSGPSNQIVPESVRVQDVYYYTAWVVRFGNVDYLKANVTDDWDFVCPNGKVLDGVSNTSCN